MKIKMKTLFVLAGVFLTSQTIMSQNPFITDQFSADPSARVFNGRVYVFPSHDIQPPEGEGRKDWFNMADYHVFSSEDLTHWTDHGVIVSQDKVDWVKSDAYSMWAPDCIERKGKYYFYFPTSPKDTATYGRGFTIGVAIADKPEGPYKPQPTPITGVRGIDPNVFIDKDGQAYLYWSAGNIYAAKLKENMVELAEEPVTLKELPEKGLKEGPYMFERNGKYYLTYPHVENNIERLEYAVGDNPLGPFKVTGVIMDESPTGCWTNHHSIITYKNQSYLFYHHNDYSPEFDKNRSIRVDSLFFNTDGTIKKVIPTLRGVGLSDAFEKIQLDRYSKKSGEGTSIAFLDASDTFKGWEITLSKSGAMVQYNQVDFNMGKAKSVTLKVFSKEGGKLQLKTSDGTMMAAIEVKKGDGWNTVKIPVKKSPKGIKDLILTLQGNTPVSVDWIQFDK